ncbi:MAG TPA: protein-L-isoaspartate(D-aspartate) O-methyltransferase [Ktedonobacteraceae bacterium]|jgi:protein-L-isoaspartate(D-aspartate) O-methyltransferase|nr:protein-L-isoaspartate(D-aspartate) O-methyltransferase [Ktedonobacteraceae bacterium]
MSRDFARHRQRLLRSLHRAGITSSRVIAAIERVPRELFVADRWQSLSYANQALPLDLGQTISQPLMVAQMTQALHLTGRERVLEIGTGSGYQTAILAQLAAHVYSVERHEALSSQAAQRLTQLSLHNVSFLVGDGSLGWSEFAPYDRILVTAASPILPTSLWEQLLRGGLMVIPIGQEKRQDLQLLERLPDDSLRVQQLGSCVFVPLIGEEGWHL